MPTIPTPFDVPFDLCFPRPDSEKWLCVKSTDIFPGKTYECGNTVTPELVSVEITFIEKTIPFFTYPAGITGEVHGWIGVEIDNPCIWFGVNEGPAGVCGKECDLRFHDPDFLSQPAHDIADQIRDTARNASEFFAEEIPFIEPGGTGEDIIYGLIIVIIVVVLLALIPLPGPPIPP